MSTFVREEDIKILEKSEAVLNLDTGRYEEQPETERTLRGNIQPVDGNEFDKLPEGIRYQDVKTLFLHEALGPEDVVEFKDIRYVMEKEVDWDSGSATIRHYMYIIKRENSSC